MFLNIFLEAGSEQPTRWQAVPGNVCRLRLPGWRTNWWVSHAQSSFDETGSREEETSGTGGHGQGWGISKTWRLQDLVDLI